MNADGARRARAVAEVLEDLADCRIHEALERLRASPHRNTIEAVLASLLMKHVASEVLQAQADVHWSYVRD
jgi:hypothetical protein